MNPRISLKVLLGAALFFAGVLAVRAQPKKAEEEHERKIPPGDVPKAAMDTFKKLAGDAEFTQFEEEIEHGRTYYEGGWKGPNGRVEALVTPGGDLIETEEVVPADQLPKPVSDAVRKMAGKDAKLFAEKKTMWLYEVKFEKSGTRHEYLFFPDGRVSEHEEKGSIEREDE